MALADRFLEWEKDPPPDLFGDPIWRLPAFRLGRFLSLVVLEDLDMLDRQPRLRTVTAQLRRAVDSITANIAEGYGRFSGRDRARFFELALSSAREAREWYWRLRGEIGEEAALERASLLTRVVRILTVAVPLERAGACERRIMGKRQGPTGKS